MPSSPRSRRTAWEPAIGRAAPARSLDASRDIANVSKWALSAQMPANAQDVLTAMELNSPKDKRGRESESFPASKSV